MYIIARLIPARVINPHELILIPVNPARVSGLGPSAGFPSAPIENIVEIFLGFPILTFPPPILTFLPPLF